MLNNNDITTLQKLIARRLKSEEVRAKAYFGSDFDQAKHMPRMRKLYEKLEEMRPPDDEVC